MEERLQKILAKAGLGSRRDCEMLISAGRVVVNGKVATLGSKADSENDHIAVDGTSLPKIETRIYIVLNKPRGVVTSVEDTDQRKTVRDLIPIAGTIYPVGRLDIDSEGLLIMTNDGELTNTLTHPRYGHEKEYQVLVGKIPDQAQLNAWKHGIVLEDGYRTTPAQVEVDKTTGKGAWLRVVLREGRKRQIREMGKRTGLPVIRITRTRIGSLYLGKLKPGEWRYLNSQEVEKLKKTPQKPQSTPKFINDNRRKN